MKIHLLLHKIHGKPRAIRAFVDCEEAEARRESCGPSGVVLDTCELAGADDIVTLARKLDEANAEIARLSAQLAALVDPVPDIVDLIIHGHRFPIRVGAREPDECAHCRLCGVSYTGTGPTCSDPCPAEVEANAGE